MTDAPDNARHRLTPPRVVALVVMLGAIAVLGYLNLQILLAPPTPGSAPPPDPMAFGGTPPSPGGTDVLGGLLDMPGRPLDHEPGHITPYPGATLIHRFARQGHATGEQVSIHTLPAGVAADAALAHYRAAASAAGFEDEQPARAGTLVRTDPQTGRALIVRIAPDAAGQTHATLALRYAIPTGPDDPARSASP